MSDLPLNEQNIKLKAEVSDWKEAVKLGAGMLVEQGCAKQSYVDGIFQALEEYGPYIIIADGLAIPHTRPEQGAVSIGCSLLTLKEPVLFEGNDNPVQVLISFSAVDNDSHLGILKMIVDFVERDLIGQIAQAKDTQELFSIIGKN